MKILVLMAQPKCAYPGQYAPEALACMTEYADSDNPEYLIEETQKAVESKDFDAIEVITLVVDGAEIDKRLPPAREPVAATVEQKN
jgi:hypothetical protein